MLYTQGVGGSIPSPPTSIHADSVGDVLILPRRPDPDAANRLNEIAHGKDVATAT